ncbi:TetR/AcrR family transcriptional regulator [Ancylobacter sp. MQZ15Z-1]|uniref:TetR/AcrR family transcriptional regulator n=1 Tax=Ancylobacter mangrovi TaxID=2972472 RepID=A0A9X2PEC3_9HYPH|nr:TetR/AcrR family transcriptional regulator [Ancylobacter mangrovi]MCS0497141.1 TetR/AcrR family transcriptional regulator [Ancylobacter mangrovi]
MRVTREKVLEHRHAILDAASQLFRERGFSDVGVAEIMQASGLTHGAFYGHFDSKADLAHQACRNACAEGLARMAETGSLGAIIERYLSPAHRDNAAHGCALSALSGEVARQSPSLQGDYAAGLADFIGEIERRLEEPDPDARRREAIGILSTMVGALTMARAVAGGDAELSDEILAAARARLGEDAAE